MHLAHTKIPSDQVPKLARTVVIARATGANRELELHKDPFASGTAPTPSV
jgi:hypothetical protein